MTQPIPAADLIPVDYIGIGAHKSGTTWLADCLRSHPQIFLPAQKEINFFDDSEIGYYCKGADWYKRLFASAPQGSIKGEFTTHYMNTGNASVLIKRHCPDVKLLACLRNPCDMIYSLYWWLKANFLSQQLPETFAQALESAPSILATGMYYDRLRPFYDSFPKENIHIVFFDDIKSAPESTLSAVYRFLGADPAFTPTIAKAKINPSKKVRSVTLSRLAAKGIHGLDLLGLKELSLWLQRSRAISNIYTLVNKRVTQYPPLAPDVRRKLQDVFEPQMAQLEKLIELPLPGGWRTRIG